MNFKKCLTLMALMTLVLAVTAPRAFASTPEGDPESGKFPVKGTATSGVSRLSSANGTTIECSKGSGSGQATSSTTGEGTYKLEGCKSSLLSCTSAGQPSGTIQLETAVTHLVYLDALHTIPGVLATPPASGVFAKFTCGGIVTVEVKGNGVMGRITSPKCGEKSKTSTVVAETVAAGTQKYMQVDGTGTKYDMTVSLNGGTFETAGTDWTVTGTAAENVTLTCP